MSNLIMGRDIAAAEATLYELGESCTQFAYIGVDYPPLCIITPWCAIDLRAPPVTHRPARDWKRDRKSERRYDRELEQMTEYLKDILTDGDMKSPLPPGQRYAIRERVPQLCAHACVSDNSEEMLKLIACSYACGAIGHELMFGQHNIWWLMGSRV